MRDKTKKIDQSHPVKVQQQRRPLQQQSLPVAAKTTYQTTLQRAEAAPHTITPADLNQLQRTIGMQAVGQLMQSTNNVSQAQQINPTRALNKMLAQRKLLIQPKLTVGPVDDQYEREADTVAKQVVQRINSPTPQKNSADGIQRQDEEEMQLKPLAAIQRQEEEELQTKQDPMLAGGEISTELESDVQGAKSGGQPLASQTQSEMKNAFGADFSAVKVHTGAKADSLNRSLSARAFTSGNNIFFRSGEYNPSSSSGKELLAHELTHTVQQGAVSTINRKMAPTIAETNGIQRKSVATSGGLFDAGQYEAVTGEIDQDKHVQSVGAVLDLNFAANEEVEGKYGLLQTVKVIRNDGFDIDPSRPELQTRIQGEDDLDQGRYFDRSKYKENPIFGLQNQAEMLGDLGDGDGIDFSNNKNLVAGQGPVTKVKESDDEDHDISDVSGAVGSRAGQAITKARLRDEPTRNRNLAEDHAKGDAISMEFETTALVIDGDMEGTYLGSVSWGFTIGENDNQATPMPFAIKSMGVPTAAFMKSAEQWNEQSQVPMPAGKTLASLPIHLVETQPDLALQILLANESAEKEEKIAAIKERVLLLTAKSDQLEPQKLQQLTAKLGASKIKFEEATANIEALKVELREIRQQREALTDTRYQVSKDQKAAKTELTGAETTAGKYIFWKKNRVKADNALAEAQVKFAELDRALTEARAAVDAAQQALDAKTQSLPDLSQADETGTYRANKMELQNYKAETANITFELANLQKTLDKITTD